MPESTSNSLNIVSWNIFYDVTRAKNGIIKPQEDRVESQAKTLMELGVDLDVVMLQEVEGESGEQIARLTGNEPGFWSQHNRMREHIGSFGQAVEAAEFYEIGHGRKIVVTRMGGVSIIGLHLSARPKRYSMRVEEVAAITELIDPECDIINQQDAVILTGDFNAIRLEACRRMLARRGFKDAFKEVGSKPPFYPTDRYRNILLTPTQQLLLGRRASIDTVLVRDVEVLSAQSFEGDSDHFGSRVTIAA